MPPAPTSAPSSARRSVPWPALAALLALVAVLVVYPPFRIVRRGATPSGTNASTAAAFDSAAYAAEFWAKQLRPAAERAPELAPLLAALARDPAAALQSHGHRVGLGGAGYFFARGTGRVTAVERSRLLVEIDGRVVAVRTGPVFGNIVRDGCGLLEVNRVPGLAEFNAVSAELNRRVEETVQPALKSGVAVGATLAFAGCAEAPEAAPAAGAPWLTFIPVHAEVKP